MLNGFSRKILWLETWTTNKDPKVIAKFFLDYHEKQNDKLEFFKVLITVSTLQSQLGSTGTVVYPKEVVKLIHTHFPEDTRAYDDQHTSVVRFKYTFQIFNIHCCSNLFWKKLVSLATSKTKQVTRSPYSGQIGTRLYPNIQRLKTTDLI